MLFLFKIIKKLQTMILSFTKRFLTNLLFKLDSNIKKAKNCNYMNRKNNFYSLFCIKNKGVFNGK